jgi:hypothetical protein
MPGAQKKGQPRVVGLYIGGGVQQKTQPCSTELRNAAEIFEAAGE